MNTDMDVIAQIRRVGRREKTMSLLLANKYRETFLNSINPYIRLAYYHTMKPGLYLQPRVIYDYEIVYIKSGSATITIENNAYEASAGDFFFFRPGKRHSILVHDTPLVQPHIHFDFIYQRGDSSDVTISFLPLDKFTNEQKALIRPDIAPLFFKDFPDRIHLRNTQLMELLLFDVIFAYEKPVQFNELRLKLLFFRLLDQLFSEISMLRARTKQRSSVQAKDIRLYLEQHPARRITLDDLSRAFHLEKSSISRIFQAYYKTSPIHYHLLFRIDRAKSMIRNTNLSLSKIAEQNGFSSLQSFSRAFKREEGVMPSALRVDDAEYS